MAVSGRMSCWEDVSSRLPQGSVLGPLQFIIYINDLDNGVKCKLSKFADDTKLGGKVDSRGGGDQIQESIDTCIDWAKDWQMEFNLSKCKVLGMGKNNENRDYRMQGVILERVTQEKDLGVVIDMGGKQEAQCQAAIGKANRVLGCIRRGIIYISKEVVLTLYRNLVRATSRILCAVLVNAVPEGHRCQREGSAQAY